MKVRFLWKLSIIGLTAVVAFLVFSFTGKPEADNPNNVLNLQPPPFISTVLAAPATQTGTSFLESEAGIAAYTQISSGSINLALVRNAFKTIEYETADYIIGSVALPDYQEIHDVHVYVNTGGWVVAYYLAWNPASKIIDLRHYDGVSITTTKLKMAMDKVLVEIGVVSFTTSYYDFRYPNATKLMLITEQYSGSGNSNFDFQMPDNFAFYERSWAHYNDHNNSTKLYLDGTEISYINIDYYSTYGVLTPVQVPPSTYHAISISSSYSSYRPSAGIALVYNEGP